MRHHIETHMGVMVDIRRPSPDDIFIADIAHSLARECRYGNFVEDFYSVAQHSFILAWYAQTVLQKPPREVMRALMHDSPEAYLGDWPQPIKTMPEFQETLISLEAGLVDVIETALGVPVQMTPWLHEIDRRIVVDERMQLKAPTGNLWLSDENSPLGIDIPRAWGHEEAEHNFLRMFELLETAIQNEGH